MHIIVFKNISQIPSSFLKENTADGLRSSWIPLTCSRTPDSCCISEKVTFRMKLVR